MRLSNFKYLLLPCLIVIFASSLAGGAEGITTISKDQLKEKLMKGDVVIVDVRAPRDWDSSQWKIQGAQRQSPSDTSAWMGKYPKDKTIVLYCA
jgi:rhodanese-related sulfurtransferase